MEGVLYFVTEDGRLMWTKHKAYLQAVEMLTGGAGSGMVASAQQLAWINSWELPKEVGTGWGHFTKIISAGDGDIYAIQPNGDLYWYKHDGWKPLFTVILPDNPRAKAINVLFEDESGAVWVGSKVRAEFITFYSF